MILRCRKLCGRILEELVSFARSLFNASFKTNPFLERALMTGITRVSRESVFSDLNNLLVCTVKDKEYAEYFGFTKNEVKDLLAYYDLKYTDEVRALYDGYNMGGVDIF